MEEEGPGIVAGPSSLIKQLASCNNGARAKAVKFLHSWLPTQSQVSEDTLKKIWKGLFYCLWHADKAAPQALLINRLSSLLLRLPSPLAVAYFSAFLLTLHREWSGIDALRLDKFYLLIRRFMHHCFMFLKKNSWDLELTREFMEVLEKRTFCSEGKFPGNGVNYHVASVFLDELRPFLPAPKPVLDVLFEPFLTLMTSSHDKVLVCKSKSNVFDVLVKLGRDLLGVRMSGGEIDDSSELAVFGTIGLVMRLSARFYELGSSTQCVQGNRKVLFGLHQDFSELEKDLDSAGIEILIPEIKMEDNIDDDEVPHLVPIDSAPRVSNGSATKKRKKEKKPDKEGDGHGINTKKKKKKKKRENGLSVSMVVNNDEVKESGNATAEKNEISNNALGNDDNSIEFNDAVISNLQMKFEKVAAEAGMEKEDASLCELPIIAADSVRVSKKKKRKRAKSLGEKDTVGTYMISEGNAADENNAIKSAKKVRFSIKSNLVWKPHNPMPPESLRLPPSATPRGSALKKGVPPGPIREMPSFAKKKAKAKGKGRKGLKSVSPTVRRMKQLKVLSV